MSPSCLRRRNPCARTRRLFLEQFESRVLLAALAPPGLVSWYRAEGNANDFADSNNGTKYNAGTFTVILMSAGQAAASSFRFGRR